jgi:hypothetical protein
MNTKKINIFAFCYVFVYTIIQMLYFEMKDMYIVLSCELFASHNTIMSIEYMVAVHR